MDDFFQVLVFVCLFLVSRTYPLLLLLGWPNKPVFFRSKKTHFSFSPITLLTWIFWVCQQPLTIGFSWVEARGVTKHLPMHKTAHTKKTAKMSIVPKTLQKHFWQVQSSTAPSPYTAQNLFLGFSWVFTSFEIISIICQKCWVFSSTSILKWLCKNSPIW